MKAHKNSFRFGCTTSILIMTALVPLQYEEYEAANAKGNLWHRNFNKALKIARKTNKPLLVDVYAVWCGYCKRLQSEIYPNKNIRRLRKRYVSVRINGPENPEFMRKHRISGFPHIIFMDKNGFTLEKIVGFPDVNRLSRAMLLAYSRKDIESKLIEQTDKDPRSVTSALRTAQYYFVVKLFPQARKYFVRAWKIKGKTKKDEKYRMDSLFNAAVSSMEMSDYKSAVSFWSYFLREKVPDKRDKLYARFYRGLSHRRLKQYRKSRFDLKYVADKLPNATERERVKRLLAKMR